VKEAFLGNGRRAVAVFAIWRRREQRALGNQTEIHFLKGEKMNIAIRKEGPNHRLHLFSAPMGRDTEGGRLLENTGLMKGADEPRSRLESKLAPRMGGSGGKGGPMLEEGADDT